MYRYYMPLRYVVLYHIVLLCVGLRRNVCRLELYVVRKTDSIHHHHPEGVVYRGFCLNSSTVAVSKFPFRWWWCIESVFPVVDCMCIYIYIYIIYAWRKYYIIDYIMYRITDRTEIYVIFDYIVL